ncbi:carboxypeptidase-like regulatory domain-containing protein [Spirosoma jeollabukense]
MIDTTINEQLIAATIVVAGTQTGTVTNAYDYFSLSLTLPASPITLRMSYTGYTTIIPQVDLSK